MTTPLKSHRLLVLALLVLTAAAYLPGLSGPFFYDDISNFKALGAWLDGQLGWQTVIFEHNAGPLGRPVAMATFLANAWLAGMDPFWFKFTNLLLHLGCGVVLFALARRLAGRDPLFKPHADSTALTVTAIWLLHPLMVSTVLYAVQRMTILSALFVLLALLAYVSGREYIENGQVRRGALRLFLWVPLFTLLAALSKENGLLAPLLCGVLEWVYFRPAAGRRRQAVVRAFLALGVALPVAAGLLVLLLKPDFVFGAYALRPFGPWERLLTETRVLFDYLGQLLIPRGPQMSLFRDDYLISTSLFQPWSTAVSIVGWVVLIGGAIALRKTLPAVTAGLGFYLVGHAMESSIFPLLIYFEHRNYLPSVGIFWALTGSIVWIFSHLSKASDGLRRLPLIALSALVLILAVATTTRAAMWRHAWIMLDQIIEHYPESRAARMARAEIDMNVDPPMVNEAIAHYRHLLDSTRPSTRIIGAAGIIAAACHTGIDPDANAVQVLLETKPESFESDVNAAIGPMTEIIIRSQCQSLPLPEIARTMASWAAQFDVPPSDRIIWQLRYRAAQLMEFAGREREALQLAQTGWHGGRDQAPLAMMLLRLSLRQGDLGQAREWADWLSNHLDPNDTVGQTLLQRYRADLERRMQGPDDELGRILQPPQ
ncbi:MAG: hypothetical protein Kow0020_09220 [Wenzhouxiangellaceae bacterium]